MSKQKSDEELLLEEFEKMLSEGGFNFGGTEPEDEEDFGYYSIPSRSRFNSDYSHDFDFEEPPEIPREARCRHERKEKRYLITSYYFVCKDCGKEIDEK